MDKNLKILCTGHKGFIGSKLFEKFPNAIGLDIKDGNDIMNCELPDADIIYHLAAQTSVENSWSNIHKDSENIPMTIRLALRYRQSKIIYVQSAASLEITSPYGLSKATSEAYLKLICPNLVVCVLPNIFGGGNGVVDLFKGQTHVDIYGDGHQIRDFVHVDDIVDGLVKAKDWKRGKYEMGSGKGTKIIDLAKGKNIHFKLPRTEIRESILKNTTPNWLPVINVIKYLK